MLDETGLWRDVAELPATLEATLRDTEGTRAVARLLGDDSTRRVVASGNGAAYYVAVALWLASLEGSGGPEVQAVPSGLLARGAFSWRPGDVLLAVSSSGEFRDLVEATEAIGPVPVAAITATPGSTLGTRASARALVTVEHQRAVTHTQAFCGGVLAALHVWSEVTSDAALADALRRVPGELDETIGAAHAWSNSLDELAGIDAAAVFGSGPGWAAALEAALLLKEISCIPAEGVETREGATSTMMPLRPGMLALSLPAGPVDPLLQEAEEACAAQGAVVARAPSGGTVDRRLAAISTFPAANALSARIGLARELDVDSPAWTDAYYRVARRGA